MRITTFIISILFAFTSSALEQKDKSNDIYVGTVKTIQMGMRIKSGTSMPSMLVTLEEYKDITFDLLQTKSTQKGKTFKTEFPDIKETWVVRLTCKKNSYEVLKVEYIKKISGTSEITKIQNKRCPDENRLIPIEQLAIKDSINRYSDCTITTKGDFWDVVPNSDIEEFLPIKYKDINYSCIVFTNGWSFNMGSGGSGLQPGTPIFWCIFASNNIGKVQDDINSVNSFKKINLFQPGSKYLIKGIVIPGKTKDGRTFLMLFVEAIDKFKNDE